MKESLIMSQRKISECINVRINVGNYQHVELSKYAEASIEYSSDEERIEKEDQLRDELVASLIRSMKSIPEKLGKGVEAAIEVEEAIRKAIPEWLSNGPVPNIANTAEKKHIQNAAEQKSEKDKAEDDVKGVLDPDSANSDNGDVAEEPRSANESASDEEGADLFEEDEMPEPEKVEGADATEEDSTKAENDSAEAKADSEEAKAESKEAKAESKEAKEEKKPVAVGEGLDEFFDGDDDDLFGEM